MKACGPDGFLPTQLLFSPGLIQPAVDGTFSLRFSSDALRHSAGPCKYSFTTKSQLRRMALA